MKIIIKTNTIRWLEKGNNLINKNRINKIAGIIKVQVKRDHINAKLDSFERLDQVKKDVEKAGLRVTHENPFYHMIMIEE
jgi:hypothetical protein